MIICLKKNENLDKFFETGKANGELVRYLPGLTKPLYQGQLKGTTKRKAFADDTYKDLKVAEYTIQLSNNEYMNFHGVHLVFPMKIKKKSNVANNIRATEITVNNFFAHWIKEIDIKCLGNDVPILPTTNAIPIYRYSDRLLKHMPKNSLAIIENDLLYSKKTRLNYQLVKINARHIQQLVKMQIIELMVISMIEFENFKNN